YPHRGYGGYFASWIYSDTPKPYNSWGNGSAMRVSPVGWYYDSDKIRPDYNFDVSCQGSVPEAIIAFLESTDFENSIRLAVSIGGDSDTIACITGGIAEAFYQTIPDYIAEMTSIILGPDLMIDTVIPFSEKYGNWRSA
ncbi:MAG: ADP-ribosylglycohydrolase family protein, partial [Spirochaetaceae bacterium]|nr:ADP-ribosylglycohydrolase family protein [Spirochaetaceae bacterium]